MLIYLVHHLRNILSADDGIDVLTKHPRDLESLTIV